MVGHALVRYRRAVMEGVGSFSCVSARNGMAAKEWLGSFGRGLARNGWAVREWLVGALTGA